MEHFYSFVKYLIEVGFHIRSLQLHTDLFLGLQYIIFSSLFSFLFFIIVSFISVSLLSFVSGFVTTMIVLFYLTLMQIGVFSSVYYNSLFPFFNVRTIRSDIQFPLLCFTSVFSPLCLYLTFSVWFSFRVNIVFPTS